MLLFKEMKSGKLGPNSKEPRNRESGQEVQGTCGYGYKGVSCTGG